MSLKCELIRIGYDPFIDFLKGTCIILIILNHCIPSEVRHVIGFSFWGSPAVPVFLIIQVFHFYKKGIDAVKFDYKKIWKRVVRPFILVELIILVVWIFHNYTTNASAIPSTKDGVYMLTGGPGAYYPWIYIQFAIMLPLFRPLFKIKSTYILIFFLLISQLVEVFCALCAMPEWIYRLTFFRYIFLFYLGFLLATKDYTLNGGTMLLSIISIASVVCFTYTDIDYFPFFYNVEAWSTCHWICYLFMVYIIIISLKYIYIYLHNHSFSTILELIGKYSYEIYLFQLLYFTCVSGYINKLFGIENSLLMSVVISVLLCVIPVLIYKSGINAFIRRT